MLQFAPAMALIEDYGIACYQT